MLAPNDFTSFTPQHIDGNLSLRVVAIEDAPALATFIEANRKHLSVFLSDLTDDICDVTTAARHLTDVVELRLQNILLEMHVWDGSRLCGALRLRDVDWQHRNAKIGYLLDANDQGRGVMNRVLTIFLRWAFDELAMHRIELRCDPRNAASIAVAQRLGFAYEGLARNAERRGEHYDDVMIFARLRTD